MQNHRDGDYSSQDRRDFSDFFFKLVNKHGSFGTVSLGEKKNHNAEKLNTILNFTIICCLASAAGAPQLSIPLSLFLLV